MLEVSDLPKDPIEALKFALMHMVSISRGNATYASLKQQKHQKAKELIITFAIIRQCAERISDDDLRSIVLDSTQIHDDATLDGISTIAESALNAIIAFNLDDHFFNDEDVKAFDYAELDADDKAQIRELMAKARRVLDTTQVLPEWQKRKVQHHISKIENELHKEKSNFQTFLAASGDVIGLVKKFGEDVQPVAEAIQKARTVTEKKVQGYEKITAEEAPKQLPKPAEGAASNE